MESAKKKPKTDFVKCEEHFSSGNKEYEASSACILKYDELRAIFKFLNVGDLSRAACVCKPWEDAAKDEMAARLSPEYILKRFAVPRKSSGMGARVINATDGKQQKKMGDLLIKPYLGISFFTPYSSLCLPEAFFFKHVPSSFKQLAEIGGYGIVTDDFNIKYGNRVLHTFLPKIPNLKINELCIYSFHKEMHKQQKLEKIKKFFENCLCDSNQESTCVLLLTVENDELTNQIVKYFQDMYKPGSVALWGGECLYLRKGFEKIEQVGLLTCLAISISSPLLQSWSVVLPKSCTSEDEMQKELQDFAKKIHLKNHCLAMMCTYIIRDDSEEDYEDSDSDEDSEEYRKKVIAVFKSVFPRVPLVGFYGDGEYGLNTLNTDRESILHQSSTVFLILTY